MILLYVHNVIVTLDILYPNFTCTYTNNATHVYKSQKVTELNTVVCTSGIYAFRYKYDSVLSSTSLKLLTTCKQNQLYINLYMTLYRTLVH